MSCPAWWETWCGEPGCAATAQFAYGLDVTPCVRHSSLALASLCATALTLTHAVYFVSSTVPAFRTRALPRSRSLNALPEARAASPTRSPQPMTTLCLCLFSGGAGAAQLVWSVFASSPASRLLAPDISYLCSIICTSTSLSLLYLLFRYRVPVLSPTPSHLQPLLSPAADQMLPLSSPPSSSSWFPVAHKLSLLLPTFLFLWQSVSEVRIFVEADCASRITANCVFPTTTPLLTLLAFLAWLLSPFLASLLPDPALPPSLYRGGLAPLDTAGLLAKLSFSWINPMFRVGAKRQLGPKDLPALSHTDSTLLWASATELELTRARARACTELKTDGHTPPQLWRVLWRLTGRAWVTLGLLKLASVLIGFAPALALRALVTWVDDWSASSDTDRPSLVLGYLCALSLTAAALSNSVVGTQFDLYNTRISARVRSGLTSSIYKIMLARRLGDTRGPISKGEACNLVSVDVQRIVGTIANLHSLWSLPIQVAVTLLLLYREVASAFVTALVVLVIMVPINMYIALRIAVVTKEMMHFKDERVRCVTEVLRGMRVVKLLAWEGFFLARVVSARKQELRGLATRKYLDAWCVYFWAAMPVWISAATWCTLVLMGKTPTASAVFTAQSLLGMLIVPLNAYPWVLNGVMEASVSHARLTDFLLSFPKEAPAPASLTASLPATSLVSTAASLITATDTQKGAHQMGAGGEAVQGIATGEGAVSVNNALFRWPQVQKQGAEENKEEDRGDAEENKEDAEASVDPFQVCIPRINVPQGGLLVVTGQVGAGKSSLLQGLLAEVPVVALDASISSSGPTSSSSSSSSSSSPAPSELVHVCGVHSASSASALFPSSSVSVSASTSSLSFLPALASSSDGVAYAAQEAWLQRGTVQDNVLFRAWRRQEDGQRKNARSGDVEEEEVPPAWDVEEEHEDREDVFDEKLYSEVLNACCLTQDLARQGHGDMTELGEEGSTLSGGQQTRLVLARAAYHALARPSVRVAILDDPLSSLDSKTQRMIWRRLLGKEGLLARAGIARVLATHALHLLPADTHVMVLHQGQVVQRGTASELSLQEGMYAQLVQTGVSGTTLAQPPHNPSLEGGESGVEDKRQERGKSASDGDEEEEEQEAADNGKEEGDALVEDEERAKGRVALQVWASYWRSSGPFAASVTMLCLVLMHASAVGYVYWLSYWVDRIDSISTRQFLVISGSVVVGNSVVTLLRSFLFAMCGLTAAKLCHHRLLHAVLYAAPSFFQRTPVGRLINRFAADTYTVDDTLPFILNIALAQTVQVLGSVAVLCVSAPLVLVLLLPLCVVYHRLQRRYRASSRELRRLVSVAQSPVYAQLSETLEGAATIRAMGSCHRFHTNHLLLLKTWQQADVAAGIASVWLSWRLQLLGGAVTTFVAVTSVLCVQLNFGNLSAGLVGLALSYAGPLVAAINGLMSSAAETEKEMVSVERVEEYSKLQSEEDSVVRPGQPLQEVPSTWPSQGRVQVVDVSMRYASAAPLALMNVSLDIPPGQKLVVVGRTGSGKSSLLSSLFRLTPSFESGHILVDDVDSSHVSLRRLRSSLGVIPQKPVLFAGSIRNNLDPGHTVDDDTLWHALTQAQLTGKVQSLDDELGEGGQGWSVGQRQLLCLARALVLRPKVLAVDEATASVDNETERVITSVIATSFKDCTVITVAHRLATVLAAGTRVVVMRDGRVVEDGCPQALLAQSTSHLAQMFRKEKHETAAPDT